VVLIFVYELMLYFSDINSHMARYVNVHYGD